jgi:hypothetical protein
MISAILAALILSAPVAALAEAELTPSRLEVSGFGTLGVVRTDTDHAEFTRDQSQHKGATNELTARQDSLIGLQAYFRASNSLEFVAQGVSRYGPRANYRPELMAAFAKFAVSPNLSLRAGRMGVEFYMLADSRLIGYSYLTVRPPVDFFATLPFQYVNGVDLTAATPLGDGILKGKVFVGQSGEDAPIYNELLSLRGNRLAGGYLDYQSGNWQWRVTYAQMQFRHDLPAPVSTLRDSLMQASTFGFPSAAIAADRISVVNTTSKYSSIGGVYDRGPLQIQAMLSEIRHESDLYQNTRAGYLIGGYRLGEFTPFAVYSRTQSRARSLGSGLPDFFPPFARINAGLAGALARTHTDQHTISFGTRWDFRRNMALKAQVDMVRGARDSIFLYPTNDAGFNGKLNVFSLALDFVF